MLTTTFTALLALPLILYIPGLMLTLALFGPSQPADPFTRHFERALVSVLLSGWLALLLAELGVYSLPLLLVLLALCAVPPALVAVRRGGLRIPPAHPLGIIPGRIVQPNKGEHPLAQHVDRSNVQTLQHSNAFLLASVAVLLLGGLLVVRPFEVVLGGRDAGVYAITGIAIARTGAIVQHDALLQQLAQDREAGLPYAAHAYSNFFSSQNPERFIATRLRAAGFFVNEGDALKGRVVPQFFHLFAVWIAIFASIFGMYGGLLATGLMATLGLWSVMSFGRTLAGPAIGLVAGLLLALNGVQVWFGRYSTSESTAQLLTFAALYAFARWHQTSPPSPEKREKQPAAEVAPVFYATLTGLAAGQLALTRIDFFLLVGPLALFLAYSAISRRWTRAHLALSLALAATLGHAALHTAFVARAYFFDTAFARLQDYALTAYLALPFQTETLKSIYRGTTRSQLKDPLNLVRELLVIAAILACALALYRFPGPLRAFEALLARFRTPLLTLGAASLLALGAYGYFVRPQLLNADVLLNTRGGWGDPLERSPDILRDEVQRGVSGIRQARDDYGVVFLPSSADLAETERLRASLELRKIERQTPPGSVALKVDSGELAPPTARSEYGVAINPLVVDQAATAALRAELRARRGLWAGPFSNATPNWLRLQGYIGAPVAIPPGTDPRYTIAFANMVRVGWYLSPLGMLLAVVGMALWLRRGLNRASWLFFAVALAVSLFYIRQSYGTSDQTYIYILRRFVPVVYPAACLGIAYTLVWTARLQAPGSNSLASAASWGTRIAVLLLGTSLVLFNAGTNLKIYRHTEYAGALEQLGTLAARLEPGAIIIFRGGGTGFVEIRDVPEMVMAPLRFAFGVDALVVKSEQPGHYASDIAAQVRRWQSAGRPVYVALSSNGGAFSLPGLALEPAGSFELSLAEFEQLSEQKPHNVGSLRLPFALYHVAPTGTSTEQTAVGPASFAAQLRGFYRPEDEGFVWTNADALLRLPYTRTARPSTLTLRLAAGQRPATLDPARVCVSVLPEHTSWHGGAQPRDDDPPFTTLGCVDVASSPADYHFALDPARVPPASTGTLLVRLQAAPWVPAEADPSFNDRRLLGVQLHRASLP
jgi:hypothetical protein